MESACLPSGEKGMTTLYQTSINKPDLPDTAARLSVFFETEFCFTLYAFSRVLADQSMLAESVGLILHSKCYYGKSVQQYGMLSIVQAVTFSKYAACNVVWSFLY